MSWRYCNGNFIGFYKIISSAIRFAKLGIGISKGPSFSHGKVVIKFYIGQFVNSFTLVFFGKKGFQYFNL